MKPYIKYLILPICFAITFIIVNTLLFVYNSQLFSNRILLDNTEILLNDFFEAGRFRLLIPVMTVIFLFSLAYKQTKITIYNSAYIITLIIGLFLTGYVAKLSFSFLLKKTNYWLSDYSYAINEILFYVLTIGVVSLIGRYYFKNKDEHPIACHANEVMLIILCLSGLFGYIGFILLTHIPALFALAVSLHVIFNKMITSFLVYVMSIGIAFTCLYAWFSPDFLKRKLGIYIGQLLKTFLVSGFLIVGGLVLVCVLNALFPFGGTILIFMAVFVFMLTRSRYKSYTAVCSAAYIIPITVVVFLLSDRVSGFLYLATFPLLLLIFYVVTKVTMKSLFTDQ